MIIVDCDYNVVGIKFQ